MAWPGLADITGLLFYLQLQRATFTKADWDYICRFFKRNKQHNPAVYLLTLDVLLLCILIITHSSTVFYFFLTSQLVQAICTFPPSRTRRPLKLLKGAINVYLFYSIGIHWESQLFLDILQVLYLVQDFTQHHPGTGTSIFNGNELMRLDISVSPVLFWWCKNILQHLGAKLQGHRYTTRNSLCVMCRLNLDIKVKPTGLFLILIVLQNCIHLTGAVL